MLVGNTRIEVRMKYSPKQLTARSLARLKSVGSRLDRRARWTLIPFALLVLASVPFWSAAVRLVSPGTSASDSLHVPILVYHSIAPPHPGESPTQRQLDVDTSAFRQQMNYLVANRFNVVPLSTLMDALGGQGPLPPRAVVITFDDGWLSQYNNALPVLEQLHLTATFFIVSKQVGMGPLYMDVDQVKSVLRAGMSLQSHSRHHPDLRKLTDAELRDEILGSREDLQKMFGVDADVFAYPYGAWNPRVVAAVQAAGYRGARAFPGGSWNDTSRRYALRSVLVTDDMNAFARALGATAIAMRDSTLRVATAGRR